MRLQASAGRDKKADLRKTCYKLTLTATFPDELEALAQLYLYLIACGNCNRISEGIDRACKAGEKGMKAADRREGRV